MLINDDFKDLQNKSKFNLNDKEIQYIKTKFETMLKNSQLLFSLPKIEESNFDLNNINKMEI